MTQAPTLCRERPEISALLSELGREAHTRRFEVAPNPCVGAAVLAAGRIVARGFHERWGGPHAEVLAIEAARESGVPQTEWDTLVVTLEPCCSEGKTPPCVDLVLRTGFKRVIAGALDPDPRHRGRGLEALRAAGVEVVLLEGASPLEVVAPHFLRWMSHERLRRPRPWTIVKWAQTRSGQLSPPEDVGEGRWISCPAALAEVHLLRGRVDAIVTGVGTVRADDPRLTVRPPGDVRARPARVVLDSWLRTSPQARILRPADPGHGGGETHILCLGGLDVGRQEALLAAGAQLHVLHSNAQRQVDMRDVLAWLWSRDYRRVLIEAGPTLIARCFEREFVDQVRVYTGAVNGGRGPSLAGQLTTVKLYDRDDSECGSDSRFQAFVEAPTR